jgi:signal transduction histidine kinase
LQADPAFVELDRTQLELAVLNALVNARDAISESGTVTIATSTIEVAAHNADEHGTGHGMFVLLSIADTGKGMPPEILARVTERYFTTKDAGKGTGLGLSQIYDFVTQARGCLKIDTCPGSGTTIRMYFPCVAAGQA